jgi:hypothetical protein
MAAIPVKQANMPLKKKLVPSKSSLLKTVSPSHVINFRKLSKKRVPAYYGTATGKIKSAASTSSRVLPIRSEANSTMLTPQKSQK